MFVRKDAQVLLQSAMTINYRAKLSEVTLTYEGKVPGEDKLNLIEALMTGSSDEMVCN